MVIRTLLALVAALFISTSAYAADKGKTAQIKAAQQPAPVADESFTPSWTGFYAGLGVGLDKQTAVDGGGTYSANDFSGVVAVGYDTKVPGTMIVLGVMGDMAWQRKASDAGQVDRTWFLGGRGGILLSPTVLMYALAGNSQAGGKSLGSLDGGFTYGAGVEAFVAKNLTVKIEWRHLDLGETAGGSSSNEQQVFRLGANYRFNTDKLFGQ